MSNQGLDSRKREEQCSHRRMYTEGGHQWIMGAEITLIDYLLPKPVHFFPPGHWPHSADGLIRLAFCALARFSVTTDLLSSLLRFREASAVMEGFLFLVMRVRDAADGCDSACRLERMKVMRWDTGDQMAYRWDECRKTQDGPRVY